MCQQHPNEKTLKILNIQTLFQKSVEEQALYQYEGEWSTLDVKQVSGRKLSRSQEGDSKISKCFWLRPLDIFWNRFWVSNTSLFKWKYKSTFLNQMHTCDFFTHSAIWRLIYFIITRSDHWSLYIRAYVFTDKENNMHFSFAFTFKSIYLVLYFALIRSYDCWWLSGKI